MREKVLEKQKARQLRTEGKSVNEIASELQVSKSSVSVWVSDVKLSPEQEDRLRSISPRHPRQCAEKNKQDALKERKEFQEQGKRRAEQPSLLFAMGCMLYWGEGTKNRNAVRISNADPELLRLFMRFLREEFEIENEYVSIRISAYSNNGLSCEEIENHWLKILALPPKCLKQTVMDRYATANAEKNKKKGKLPYGTCELTVGKTSVVQEIFGAIQRLGSFERESWLL